MESKNSTPLFSMPLVGSNISRLRKARGMTQMQLADAMGISFQAVSNWERGLSCPDIAKLGDLAALFGVSIDEILGNKRSAEIAEEFNNDKTPEMTISEVAEMAPILSEKQVERAVEEHSDADVSIEDLIVLAPFLSTETLDQLADRAAPAPLPHA